MLRILYLIRAEADFERVIALAIACKGNAGKDKVAQFFVFAGDMSWFYKNGIKNEFQKYIFQNESFEMKNFWEFDFVCRTLSKICGENDVTLKDTLKGGKSFISFVKSVALRQLIKRRKEKIVKKVFSSIRPEMLIADQFQTIADYVPEIFRQQALSMNIPVFLFPHGAAGGLHGHFSFPVNHDKYRNCHVVVCNEKELPKERNNHLILGDVSSSYPFISYIHSIDKFSVTFQNLKQHRIVFFIGGNPTTSTNAWSKMEEIIIDLSENEKVAMIIKTHPRDSQAQSTSIITAFSNVKIVGSDYDHTRLVKWANIVVCSDQCSMIFEPMILGKKVVAVEGKHIPKFKNCHSPIKYSSVLHISSADEFDLENIPNADSKDSVSNTVAWGGHGKVDLAKLFHEKLDQSFNSVYQND
jgi:hypothetical protein